MTGEFDELFNEFLSDYADAEKGRHHLDQYAVTRSQARANYSDIVAKKSTGADVTDDVLARLLPHADSQINRQRGAWLHPAPVFSTDPRKKYLWVDGSLWPTIATRIFDFVRRCVDDPGSITSHCDWFVSVPEAKGFQSGSLSPILNALNPEAFSIVNSKSLGVVNLLTHKKFKSSLAEYPGANEAVLLLVESDDAIRHAAEKRNIRPVDLFDCFCHWLIAIKKFALVEADEIEALFKPRAFELLRMLDENPTTSLYQKHKADFRSTIELPFRVLFAAIAERLTDQMKAALETEKRLFARFPKNDYGKGGAWPFYWGAFYPKGSQRVSGIQLFVTIGTTYVTYGFYIGDPDGEAAERVAATLRDSKLRGALKLDSILSTYSFGREEGERRKERFETLADVLSNGTDRDLLDIRRIVPWTEASSRSVDDFATDIAESFVELFPLVEVATGQEPHQISYQPAAAHTPQSTIAEKTISTAPDYPIEKIAENTGFSPADIRTWVRAIERKGQAVFYGPPGTGKTFVAEHLARHLIGGGDGFVEVLQFHPAYSYEDFMEGIRPQSNGIGLSYPVVPGRFRAFCERARQRTDRCVLIIDEINRANLARVMGELMYLLEYRTKSVPLASGTDFSIPMNVRIIGTMNTADRSIALVDHALRRRFAFIQLQPDYEVLRRFHHSSTFANSLVGVLQKLNKQIEPHYQVGTSFFLVTGLEHHIADIWRMEIEPYLEEYFFDQPEKRKEFDWSHIGKDLALPVEPADAAEPESNLPLPESSE